MNAMTKTTTLETRALAKPEDKAAVKWKGEIVNITFSDVKSLICRLATDQEVVVFLKTCQSLQLNPFASEIFLIKYGERDKAAIVISINSYLKAAEANEKYNGCEAGIILRDSDGKLEFREGAFLLDEEERKLAGGWARVYRKDRDRPTYIAVNKTECVRLNREGRPTQFWEKEKQPSMLRKVALKRALVEAFPSLFAGTLSTVEAAGEIHDADYRVIEGELPPAMEREGKPDWKKFWSRVKSELGLTTEEARVLLQVDSIKDDLIETGCTMESVWDELVKALQRKSCEAPGVEQSLDGGADEIVDWNENSTQGDEQASSGASTRDPQSIRSVNDLLRACNQDFGMQPKDVYAEINVKSGYEIREQPCECYRRIAAVRI